MNKGEVLSGGTIASKVRDELYINKIFQSSYHQKRSQGPIVSFTLTNYVTESRGKNHIAWTFDTTGYNYGVALIKFLTKDFLKEEVEESQLYFPKLDKSKQIFLEVRISNLHDKLI